MQFKDKSAGSAKGYYRITSLKVLNRLGELGKEQAGFNPFIISNISSLTLITKFFSPNLDPKWGAEPYPAHRR